MTLPTKIRIASYALIFFEEKILLTLLNRGPNAGKWTLPGGGLNSDETSERALEREVYEETGLKLSEFQFLTRYDSEYVYQGEDPIRVIKNIYVKHIQQELPVHVVLTGDSTLDVKWIELDSFDKNLIHPTVHQALDFFKKTFRKAKMDDADVLVQLVNSAYRGDSSKKGWTTEADILGGQRVDVDRIREMISVPDSWIEVVMNSETPSEFEGCVHLKKINENVLYFGMLVVRPGLQNQGIGKILLSRVETLASELGFKRVQMSVIHTRSELIRFYERRGYRATGRSEEFPATDPRFGVPKVEGLKLLEFEKNLKTNY